MKKRSVLNVIIPFIIVSVISILGYFTEIMEAIDYKLYDAALAIKPLAKESDKFLNVVVDDATLDKLDMYPLKRSTLSDGMMILGELGVKTIMLDTQLVDSSTPGVDSTQMNNMPYLISLANQNTFSIAKQLTGAIARGQIVLESSEELEDYLTDLEWEYDDIFDNLLKETNKIALNFDDYIANNFKFINNVYVTNDFEIGKDIGDEMITYLQENHALKNIEVIEDPFQKRDGYNPTIKIIMDNTLGAGFVETLIDSDGKTRKTDLILNKDGYYYPQLAFKTYLDRVGNPKIISYKNKIVLEGVQKEGKSPYNLTIPLDSTDGSMAINWAGKDFFETFDELKFYKLYLHDLDMKDLYRSIKQIVDFPLTNRFASSYIDVLNIYDMAEEIKAGGDPEELEDYISYREEFINQAILIFNGTDEIPPLNIQYRGMVEQQLELYEFSPEDVETILAGADSVDSIFKSGSEVLNNVIRIRSELKEQVKDTIVTFGYIATSTFDIGANPFEFEYYNLGIYSTIYNNLLSEEFIRLLPKWISIIAAFILAILASRIIRKREAGRAIILGSGLFILLVAAYILTFMLTNTYLYILIPGLSFVLVFIQMISSKLVSTSKDRAFIKSAFGQYLSEDVIKEILDDPTKLELGGEKKEITAFFTDVKGFSTISEKLTPDELVHLLNDYLTAMSDIALDEKGTIDKYEGDAIIGFFGAPHPLPTHPTNAIRAAIRMKEKEAELNTFFIENGLAPSPLQTRIGINSGPCVVGNMGTPKKMDYTMMGNDVNIAARLEGVNKQYGTWILASERTMNGAEDIFLSRRLDRVRVVGINEPIRLHNPIAMKADATEAQISMVAAFEEGLTKFEERDWTGALSSFKKSLSIDPEDKPSVRYIKMCEKFIKEPPESEWDGVFNLTSK